MAATSDFLMDVEVAIFQRQLQQLNKCLIQSEAQTNKILANWPTVESEIGSNAVGLEEQLKLFLDCLLDLSCLKEAGGNISTILLNWTNVHRMKFEVEEEADSEDDVNVNVFVQTELEEEKEICTKNQLDEDNETDKPFEGHPPEVKDFFTRSLANQTAIIHRINQLNQEDNMDLDLESRETLETEDFETEEKILISDLLETKPYPFYVVPDDLNEMELEDPLSNSDVNPHSSQNKTLTSISPRQSTKPRRLRSRNSKSPLKSKPKRGRPMKLRNIEEEIAARERDLNPKRKVPTLVEGRFMEAAKAWLQSGVPKLVSPPAPAKVINTRSSCCKSGPKISTLHKTKAKTLISNKKAIKRINLKSPINHVQSITPVKIQEKRLTSSLAKTVETEVPKVVKSISKSKPLPELFLSAFQTNVRQKVTETNQNMNDLQANYPAFRFKMNKSWDRLASEAKVVQNKKYMPKHPKKTKAASKQRTKLTTKESIVEEGEKSLHDLLFSIGRNMNEDVTSNTNCENRALTNILEQEAGASQVKVEPQRVDEEATSSGSELVTFTLSDPESLLSVDHPKNRKSKRITTTQL